MHGCLRTDPYRWGELWKHDHKAIAERFIRQSLELEPSFGDAAYVLIYIYF